MTRLLDFQLHFPELDFFELEPELDFELDFEPEPELDFELDFELEPELG